MCKLAIALADHSGITRLQEQTLDSNFLVYPLVISTRTAVTKASEVTCIIFCIVDDKYLLKLL